MTWGIHSIVIHSRHQPLAACHLTTGRASGLLKLECEGNNLGVQAAEKIGAAACAVKLVVKLCYGMVGLIRIVGLIEMINSDRINSIQFKKTQLVSEHRIYTTFFGGDYYSLMIPHTDYY